VTINLPALSRAAIDAVKTQQLIDDDHEREFEALGAQFGENAGAFLKPRQLVASYEISFCASVERRRAAEVRLAVMPVGLSAFARSALDVSRMSRFTVEVVQTPVLRNPFAPQEE
jgi:hypothetical protein